MQAASRKDPWLTAAYRDNEAALTRTDRRFPVAEHFRCSNHGHSTCERVTMRCHACVAELSSMGSVSVVAVLLGGSAPGLVPAARCDPYWDLAASACLGLDLSAVVAGTGLAHQLV
jgi:hypothetical protein